MDYSTTYEKWSFWNSLGSNFDFLAISYDLFENNISESEFHHKINLDKWNNLLMCDSV